MATDASKLRQKIHRNLGTMERQERIFAFTKYVVLMFFFSTIFLPYLYVFLMSFFQTTDVFTMTGVTWFPPTPTLENWMVGFNQLSGRLVNSLLISTGSAILTLAAGIPGAYVFARKRFHGRKFVFYAVVFSLLFPGLVLIPVLADIAFRTGLYNTVPSIWLAHLPSTAFIVWILRDFFEKLPSNLEDSAQVYGCTQFTAFSRVILPLAMPAIVAVGFLQFLGAWNDYLLANLLTSGSGPRPAAVQLFYNVFQTEGGANWPALLAQTFIVGVPPVVLYMLARKQISEAFAMGGG